MGRSIVSLDAELSVIGCILVDFESTMKTVCEILRPEHFADSILAETYALAYKRYCESARDLSIVTAVEHLKGDFPVSDCKERLAKAMEITVSTSVASEHANVVKNHYKARECQKLLTNALGSLPDTVHIDQNIEMIADKLGEIIREKEKNRLQSIREPIVMRTLALIRRLEMMVAWIQDFLSWINIWMVFSRQIWRFWEHVRALVNLR